MISITVPYLDFDGNQQVAECWFHLSQKKLMEMETSEPGGLSAKLQRLGASDDKLVIMNTFADLVGAAYGLRDPANPTHFRQSEEISQGFLGGPVFDTLLTMLLTDETTAAKLISGAFSGQLKKMAKDHGLDLSPEGIVTNQDATPQLPFAPEPEPPAITPDRARELSGLKNPYQADGTTLVPWAFRDPTTKEQTAMSQAQLMDCMARRSAGWEPKPA